MKSAHLINEAADWFARLEDPAASAADREAFDAWLLSSPAHIEAHLEVSRLWGDLSLALGSAPGVAELVRAARAEPETKNIVPLPPAPPAGARGKREYSFLRPRLAYAAAAILAAVLTSAVWLFADRWLMPSVLQTAVGEQRSVVLADGSIVHLNTDSEARFELNPRERRVVLSRGEARFSITRDARRPFIVATPHANIRVLGTVFNVQAFPARTAVTVLEGRVAIGTLELTAGQQGAIAADGAVLPRTGPSVEQVLAWPERQLIFRETPLSEVLAEFNRYHPQPIRIDDAELARLRINGVFNASDPASLIEYLQRYRNVIVRPLDGGGQGILLDN